MVSVAGTLKNDPLAWNESVATSSIEGRLLNFRISANGIDPSSSGTLVPNKNDDKRNILAVVLNHHLQAVFITAEGLTKCAVNGIAI
jgi:hypothetical protein